MPLAYHTPSQARERIQHHHYHHYHHHHDARFFLLAKRPPTRLTYTHTDADAPVLSYHTRRSVVAGAVGCPGMLAKDGSALAGMSAHRISHTSLSGHGWLGGGGGSKSDPISLPPPRGALPAASSLAVEMSSCQASLPGFERTCLLDTHRQPRGTPSSGVDSMRARAILCDRRQAHCARSTAVRSSGSVVSRFGSHTGGPPMRTGDPGSAFPSALARPAR